MMRDLASNIAVRPVIVPAANADLGSTPLVGTVIDGLGFNSLVYAIVLGTLSDADASYTVAIEESDAAGTGFTAVDDKYLTGTEAVAGFDFTDDGETRKLGYRGSKRYTRLTITPTGADSGNSPIAAIAILGNPAVAPVT
ncbi:MULTISPECIES: hypothetical protein [Hyphomicrobiales]|uniref:hypothetical protein n=1 Tax=Hyphomicrobiales TaxID=356 RepID=UPI001BD0216A|nr:MULTISPECIES: hypothetical protein [Hyphomicrobiales]CAH1662783.1 conserved hypothetical protein [Hyphomicrobiales bacterium]MBS7741478.1 hypothetical protein [Chelatococcus sp. HY11]MBX3491211.1 hypothetical protein [Parvibaculum sp.]MBX3544503.1 hypothetical protein [Chelatococcus sp.]MCO5078974.1 hypothetical protein [Chelatococcus sp.]